MPEIDNNPLLTDLKNRRSELSNFLKFISMNTHRQPVNVSVNFKHRKFEDSTGFAMMKGPSPEMESLLLTLQSSAEDMIIELNKKIREHDRMGSLDSKQSQ